MERDKAALAEEPTPAVQLRETKAIDKATLAEEPTPAVPTSYHRDAGKQLHRASMLQSNDDDYKSFLSKQLQRECAVVQS